jgi:hypothetical protein
MGGQVDTNTNTVTISVSRLGVFALAPALPTGELLFQLSQPAVPADGTATVTAEATNLQLNDGNAAGDGWAYTIAATGMGIVSADQDSSREGVQVLCLGGKVTAMFRAPSSGGVGTFAVSSVYGDAHGHGTIAFVDTTPPPTVTGLNVLAGQTRLALSWDSTSLPTDVAGYRIYYSENHAGPPFDGTASVDGQPSPVTLSSPPAVLKGLNLGSMYHVAVSAVDTSGNEGPLSSAVEAPTIQSPPHAPSNVMSEQDSPGQFLIMWTLSEDDGFNDRDVDRYEVYRKVIPPGSPVKIADVPAGQSAYTDAGLSLTGSTVVRYEVVAVDSAGLSSSPASEPIPGDFDFDGDVDLQDYVAFEGCLRGPLVVRAGDVDTDGDVDLADFAVWSACLMGPTIAAGQACDAARLDADPDVDLGDFATFQGLFTGALAPTVECLHAFDFDGDGDVDESDFARFQEAFTGP